MVGEILRAVGVPLARSLLLLSATGTRCAVFALPQAEQHHAQRHKLRSAQIARFMFPHSRGDGK